MEKSLLEGLFKSSSLKLILITSFSISEILLVNDDAKTTAVALQSFKIVLFSNLEDLGFKGTIIKPLLIQYNDTITKLISFSKRIPILSFFLKLYFKNKVSREFTNFKICEYE